MIDTVTCPSCQEATCNVTDCVCPECWPDKKRRHPAEVSQAQWADLTPVMHALNAEDIYWGWATDSQTHSLEVGRGDLLVEIYPRRGGKYLAESYRYESSDNTWTHTGYIEDDNPTEVAEWTASRITEE